MEIRSPTPSLAVPRVGAGSAFDSGAPADRVRSDAAGIPLVTPPETANSARTTPEQHEARFTRDDATNRLVLSVVDALTGDVLAQTPTKAALRTQAYANEIAARSTPNPRLGRLV